jgi:hypothetical protein
LIETFVSPTVFVFVIVQPMDEMGVVVESIGGRLCFVVVLAVVTRGRLFFSSLPNDTKLVVGVLDNLLQCLLEVHLLFSMGVIWFGSWRLFDRIEISPRKAHAAIQAGSPDNVRPTSGLPTPGGSSTGVVQ